MENQKPVRAQAKGGCGLGWMQQARFIYDDISIFVLLISVFRSKTDLVFLYFGYFVFSLASKLHTLRKFEVNSHDTIQHLKLPFLVFPLYCLVFRQLSTALLSACQCLVMGRIFQILIVNCISKEMRKKEDFYLNGGLLLAGNCVSLYLVSNY